LFVDRFQHRRVAAAQSQAEMVLAMVAASFKQHNQVVSPVLECNPYRHVKRTSRNR